MKSGNRTFKALAVILIVGSVTLYNELKSHKMLQASYEKELLNTDSTLAGNNKYVATFILVKELVSNSISYFYKK